MKVFFQIVATLVFVAALIPIFRTVAFGTSPDVAQGGAMILLCLAALILFGLGCDGKGGAR